MVPYYNRLSPCRIRRNTVIYGEKNDRLLSQYTEAIYDLRFAPYMIVLLCIRARRYTIVIRDHVIRPNTVVYGEIRRNTDRVRSFTSVYGFRNRRPGWQQNGDVSSHICSNLFQWTVYTDVVHTHVCAICAKNGANQKRRRIERDEPCFQDKERDDKVKCIIILQEFDNTNIILYWCYCY